MAAPLTAFTSISPLAISIIAWMGSPASKIRAAPSIRLLSPQVIAASCSARVSGMAADFASVTPSADTTMACATLATRSVKSVTSQSRRD
jgi:hypothetical protein